MALTRYPEGSMRELCYMTFPLLLSCLSVTTMVFVDRILLAHYSSTALNAVTNAMTLGWAYIFGWMMLTGISEVFVAQYNGAKQYHKLGEPIWQMVWLSLASMFFFIPLALSTDALFYQEANRELEREYFTWMMLLGWSFPLFGALCGFFIGQGKTQLVTYLAVSANLVNAGLDYILIFGVEGVLEPMGVKGAAIATGGSTVFQVLVLGGFFLNRSNRAQYKTGDYALRLKVLWQCMRIGIPGALFVAVELLGWAAFYQMMSQLGERHITVASISQSIVIFCYFFADAVYKATSAITGNLIGAGRSALVSQVVSSGVRLHLLFFGLITWFFYCFIDQMIAYFLPQASNDELLALRDSLHFCLMAVCFYLLFEGIRLLLAGVLTAAGDTMFLLIGGTLSVWLMLVAPVYYWVFLGQRTVEWAYVICVFYSLGAGLCYLWRFRLGHWKKLSLVETPIVETPTVRMS